MMQLLCFVEQFVVLIDRFVQRIACGLKNRTPEGDTVETDALLCVIEPPGDDA